MKKFVFIVCLSLLVFEGSFGQQAVTDIVEALKDGDISKISKHFDKIIDITIAKDQSTYSKTQAEIVLKNFFQKQEIKDFSVKHRGSPEDKNAVFIIGALQTKQENFRIYLYFKKKSKDFILQEIRIE